MLMSHLLRMNATTNDSPMHLYHCHTITYQNQEGPKGEVKQVPHCTIGNST
jgi:hypothetical protein